MSDPATLGKTMKNRKDIAAIIRKRSSDLADLSRETMVAVIVDDPEKGNVAGFACSFIRYQATQGYRIADWLEKPDAEDTDLLAHATRGLFESILIYRHLMSEGEDRFVNRLVMDVWADEFDIMKGLVPRSDLKKHPKQFQEHYLKLESMGLKKTPPTSKLVENEKDPNLKEEYTKYYRQYSKYTHPSLYQIAGSYEQVFSASVMVMFAKQAIQYLDQAIANAQVIKKLVTK